jgi:phosphoenolpyruvate synthase/pyruvate phosphate dikinase
VATLRALFEHGAAPDDVVAAIRRAYAGLGGYEPTVAVQSSAAAPRLTVFRADSVSITDRNT